VLLQNVGHMGTIDYAKEQLIELTEQARRAGIAPKFTRPEKGTLVQPERFPQKGKVYRSRHHRRK
jgi:hypothetical protein